MPLVQEKKIGTKDLVASLDIHLSNARSRDCVDGPGSCPASLDVQDDNYNIDYGFGAIPYYMD
ncbi:hypothetical protein L9F63_026054, partial [Diploptera punctata]